MTKRFLDSSKIKTKGKRLTKVTSKKIVDNVRENRNLPTGFDMSHWIARKRIARGQIYVNHRNHNSPLLGVKPDVVTTPKQICCSR